MQQHEIEARYRALRAIGNRQQNDALSCLARPALTELARLLGLAAGKTMVCDTDEEMALIADLAVHTAKSGRSRAIDRYAKSVSFVPGTEEALILAALRRAQFSIWEVRAPHDVAGVLVTDVLADQETWLMDENLSKSAAPGFLFAARLAWQAAFAMTCGVIVPVDADAMKEALHRPGFRKVINGGALNDRGFAAAIYRAALDTGLMANVQFRAIEMAA